MFNDGQIAGARKLAAADLYFFTRWMFLKRRGFVWQKGQHHSVICDALTRVYDGSCKRLIINIPPRYSKTELLLNWMTWSLGRQPDAEFILTSYSSGLATTNAWLAREIVQHEEYRAIFPSVELNPDKMAQNDWRTTAGGIVYAAGAGGTITGYGAGKNRPGFGGAIIIDDPHKPDEANSNHVRRSVLQWFQNTLESRKNSPDTPIILIMQRLHQEDLAGWLLDGGNGEQWEHIRMPALRDDGTALWPEKHDVESLQRIEAANRFVFAGQYQQRPVALGGNIIRGEWFHLYEVTPKIKWRSIYADTAQKTREHNDYTVFQEWGFGEDGKVYLLSQLRGRWEVPDLERRAPAFWTKCAARDADQWGVLRKMKVEDAASGTGLIQKLQRDNRIPVEGIKRHKDKYTRLLDVLGYIESGYVCLPKNAEFLSDFLTECEAFNAEGTHPHDDQIDPMIDAVQDMLSGGSAAKLWERML